MDHCTPLRISFSHMTTTQDIDALADALHEISKDFVIENTNVEHR